MIRYIKGTGFTQEIADYLNSYPAFQTDYGYMDNDFFSEKQMEDRLKTGPRCARRYFDSAECTPGSYFGRLCHDEPGPLTMKEAEEFLEWLEPIWCEWKGIRSTGFKLNCNGMIDAAAYLSDDDLVEI